MGSFEDFPEPWWKTPLVESAALSKAAGWFVDRGSQSFQSVLNRRSRVFLKLDNLQPSGSFKSR
jgi:L-serine/L-threonine ammonia-lyase